MIFIKSHLNGSCLTFAIQDQAKIRLSNSFRHHFYSLLFYFNFYFTLLLSFIFFNQSIY